MCFSFPWQINIWSHLAGCILFIGLTIFDFQFLREHAELSDQVLVVCLLVCFCLCMLMSAIYHIFSCKSEEHYELFLSVDFLGISLSLVAIYISGMYYAFWCHTVGSSRMDCFLTLLTSLTCLVHSF